MEALTEELGGSRIHEGTYRRTGGTEPSAGIRIMLRPKDGERVLGRRGVSRERERHERISAAAVMSVRGVRSTLRVSDRDTVVCAPSYVERSCSGSRVSAHHVHSFILTVNTLLNTVHLREWFDIKPGWRKGARCPLRV